MSRLKRIVIFLALPILLTLTALPVKTSLAKAEQPQDNENQQPQPCEVDFASIPLTVKAGEYAGAAYSFDENCNPVLEEVYRGHGKPSDDPHYRNNKADKEKREKVSNNSQSASPSQNLLAALDRPQSSVNMAITNWCNTETYETDPVAIRVVQVQNSTQYTWTGSSVWTGTVWGSYKTYFPWWHPNGGPIGSQPSSTQTTVRNSFYCNGSALCVQPFNITLYAHVKVLANGDCQGTGNWSGTILNLNGIPGWVFFWNWKS